jgi:UDP-N-acetylglucosamine--N-acetylmuramyl-(pentapeptide) pyrophosphoryl-undecaprenol N-acetylglucosamine transferase
MSEADVDARLGAEIDRLRHDPRARDMLSEAAFRRGEVHRSGALAELIEHVALASSPR